MNHRMPFVADFIGDSNLLSATMIRDKEVEIQGQKFACVDVGFGQNNPVDVVIRPEDMILVEPEQGTIRGKVVSLIFKGVHYEMEVEALGRNWLVHSTQMAPVGEEVGLFVDPFNIQIMKNQRMRQRRCYMKTSKSRTGFFSFPYVVWMILFVVVPLLIMAYYGFTNQNGNFTWSNILSMTEPIHRKALWTSGPAVGGLYLDLYFAGTASGGGDPQPAHKKAVVL